ncbi:coenzyme A pyrophosphatase [Carbonactinospora thermoautotrophica]|uniref:NUDIX hydrolase n=1 Tax=Carbonactinospora thermoautotrophica TaxID=1469144 RepID=UPI002271EAF5|nr:CoA pyrophosphatase [Carbonactinospora thermoautotrophica]MCX9191351.1 coenzyme A pyrophosphatase [Carbonactinospora thermoautotrophica]
MTAGDVPRLVGARISDDGLPDWLRPVAEVARTVRPEQLSRFLPPAEGGRPSAVLVLFGEGERGPDLLIIERSPDLRAHAGQPAFPGGAVDPTDDGPVHTALREAAEETGLDPSGVRVFGVLPDLYLPPRDFVITPVLGWWERPVPVRVVDPAEVASVHRVPIEDFLDPANRLRVRHPSGYVGPAFRVSGLLVWGFTAGLISRLFRLVGWERPWDTSRVEDLPPEAAELARRTYEQTPEAPSGGSV